MPDEIARKLADEKVANAEAELAIIRAANPSPQEARALDHKLVLSLAKAKAELAAFESGEARGSPAYQVVYNETFERVRKELRQRK
jgi:hypothetical protein